MHTKYHHNRLWFSESKFHWPPELTFPSSHISTALSYYKPMSEIHFPMESLACNFFFFWHEFQLTLETQILLFHQSVIGQGGWGNESTNCSNCKYEDDNNCYLLLTENLWCVRDCASILYGFHELNFKTILKISSCELHFRCGTEMQVGSVSCPRV